MAEEQKQSSGPSGPRGGGHGPGGGHGGPGGGHGGPRREGGPGGGPGGPGGPRRGKRQYFRKKKVCKFCVEKMDFIDYKRADILSQFVQERGKILPRRMTGVCSRHQLMRRPPLPRPQQLHPQPHPPLPPRPRRLNAGSGHLKQELRETTCKSFFRKISKSWGTAATSSPSSPATPAIFFCRASSPLKPTPAI